MNVADIWNTSQENYYILYIFFNKQVLWDSFYF